ncbi:glutamine--fructose-6-phosphate transaminase (isomerizing) [Candidatus Dojkabacteria bacterium]|nr:glutamine--fructose-6-phosphate transaminase (isomerizing) [Candidatus Dojkabacteria bacterium]
MQLVIVSDITRRKLDYINVTLILKMCGIFGYKGKKGALNTILTGLKRLEYRGYDSWGVSSLKKGKISVAKKVGAIGDIKVLEREDNAVIGIGHTRWATHGGVTKVNAHPHYASDKSFVLAQNGIVENYQNLKRRLAARGYKFISETDTEIIVRLIEDELKRSKGLQKAIIWAFKKLQGRNTIILLTKAGRIFAVRNGSPLVVGVGKDEIFIASDTLSFADKTDDVIFVDNLEMVVLDDEGVNIFRVSDGKRRKYKLQKLDHRDVSIDKAGFPHYMLKEIVEQKHTVREAVQYSIEELKGLMKSIKSAKNVYTVGSGTASFAAGQIAYFLRKYASIPAVELKAYEVDSYKQLFQKNDLIIAVSQSGETADTIEAIDAAKAREAKVASIVNMVGSSIPRMSDYPFFTRSGPEICVVSTKAFTSQVAWGLLLAFSVAGKHKFVKRSIEEFSKKLEKYFNEDLFKNIRKLAKELLRKEHIFVLGREQNYYMSLEGALKLKETAYKHAEGFASGELKHGVIALIEKRTPVFVIVSEDDVKDDLLSAAAEVKARGAWVIGISSKNNELFDNFIPTVDAGIADPIAKVITFQLLAYYLAVELGNTPDKPRNLAKSVTVK